MRIRVVTPIATKGFRALDDLIGCVRPDTELSQVELDNGPASIESQFDAMLAIPETVAKIIEAEREGIDAVVIDCMDDPGLHAAREAVAIPVVGPCEASMHAAAMMGHRFSVVTVAEHLRAQYEHEAAMYGLPGRLASVRSVDIPVLELEDDREALVASLTEQAELAVRQEGADVIIFGCTGMAGAAAAVEEGLRGRGLDGVPVIDPVLWAIKLAEAMVDFGLRHSKRAWPRPATKPVYGYPFVPRPEAVTP